MQLARSMLYSVKVLWPHHLLCPLSSSEAFFQLCLATAEGLLLLCPLALSQQQHVLSSLLLLHCPVRMPSLDQLSLPLPADRYCHVWLPGRQADVRAAY